MARRSDVFTVQSPALQTASGQSAAVDLSAYKAYAWWVNVTAKTGTFTDYRFFVQTSPDGTNWFGAASGTGLVVLSIAGGASDITAPSTFYAGTNNYLGPFARLAWTLAGGTNVTFSGYVAARRK